MSKLVCAHPIDPSGPLDGPHRRVLVLSDAVVLHRDDRTVCDSGILYAGSPVAAGTQEWFSPAEVARYGVRSAAMQARDDLGRPVC